MFQSWFFDRFLFLAPSTRPLLLLMDNHLSHFNPAVIKKAAESGVILTCIPPNTTHLVQPLDRCAFASLKRQWAIQYHHFTVRQGERLLTQTNFSKIFQRRGVCSRAKVRSGVGEFCYVVVFSGSLVLGAKGRYYSRIYWI